MATHSSILAWKIPWTRSLTGYNPWGRKEQDTTEHISMESRNSTDEPIYREKLETQTQRMDCGHSGRRRGETNGESSIDMYTSPCVKQITSLVLYDD